MKKPNAKVTEIQSVVSQSLVHQLSGFTKGPEQGRSVEGKLLADKNALNFDCSENDKQLVGECVKRIMQMAKEYGQDIAKIDHMLIAMDLLAAHCNGTPLKLQSLLLSSDVDFVHDVLGIGRHINRQTGQLMYGFKPIFAAEKH